MVCLLDIILMYYHASWVLLKGHHLGVKTLESRPNNFSLKAHEPLYEPHTRFLNHKDTVKCELINELHESAPRILKYCHKKLSVMLGHEGSGELIPHVSHGGVELLTYYASKAGAVVQMGF